MEVVKSTIESTSTTITPAADPSVLIPPTPQQKSHESAAIGRRRVNLLWEGTQTAIACFVIAVTLLVDAYTAMHLNLSMNTTAIATQNSALMQLNVMAALVTGFYFGRTNNERSGGIRDQTRAEDNDSR